MIQYIFSPKWFFGIDIIFELFSLMIALLIARYGYKLYRISGDAKHKNFSVFFFLIGIAFIFKIITNFDLYYINESSIEIANSVFHFTTSHVSEILFTVGFSVFKFLTLLSFFGLLYITWERKSESFWLGIYFIAIITIFSHDAYYIFHITTAVMLFLLFRYYHTNYKSRHKPGREAFLIALSFFTLMLSQVAFSTIGVDILMYVVGEMLQLAGYSMLLYDYILVKRYEK